MFSRCYGWQSITLHNLRSDYSREGKVLMLKYWNRGWGILETLCATILVVEENGKDELTDKVTNEEMLKRVSKETQLLCMIEKGNRFMKKRITIHNLERKEREGTEGKSWPMRLSCNTDGVTEQGRMKWLLVGTNNDEEPNV